MSSRLMVPHLCAIDETVTIRAGADRLIRSIKRNVKRKWPTKACWSWVSAYFWFYTKHLRFKTYISIKHTHVVDSDLHLKTICCFTIWACHHSCIVNQDIELFLLLWKKQWVMMWNITSYAILLNIRRNEIFMSSSIFKYDIKMLCFKNPLLTDMTMIVNQNTKTVLKATTIRPVQHVA